MSSQALESPVELLVQRELPAASAGDRHAFSRIVGACQNSVTAIALAIVRDVQASEDIAQEAFVKAWHNLGRLQNASSFLPWLRQITRNLARDHLRQWQRLPRMAGDAEAAIEAAADPQPGPCGHLLAAEQRRVATELISTLPDESREVLLLYYREGRSSQQVASLLGLSDAAVRKRLSRARATIRAELLARLGRFALDSAPSAAFTTLVSSALTVASPPAAATGILGSAAAAGGAKTFGKILAGSLGSIGMALIVTWLGIYLGMRRYLRQPFDQAERRGLIRSGLICSAAALGFLVAITLVARFDDGWLPMTLITLAFLAIVFYQAGVVQPRLLKPRHAHEARVDPIAAGKRRRRERILCWAGSLIGGISGLGGLIAGLVMSGRI